MISLVASVWEVYKDNMIVNTVIIRDYVNLKMYN